MNKGAVRLDGTWRVGRKKEAFVCVAPYQERHLGLRARSEQLTRIIWENPAIDDRKVMDLSAHERSSGNFPHYLVRTHPTEPGYIRSGGLSFSFGRRPAIVG